MVYYKYNFMTGFFESLQPKSERHSNLNMSVLLQWSPYSTEEELLMQETSKCKAAKEVIKSLTAQLKDMAERLPVGAARDFKSPSFSSFGSNLTSSDVLLNPLVDQPNGQPTSYKEPDSSGSNTPLVLNGSSTIINCNSGQNKAVPPEASARNSSRSKDGEDEWVEQDEPGVYITLTSLPGGIIDLKRVRFSRKRFSEKQAEQWWAENRVRIYQRYNVRVVDKSSIGTASEDLAQ